MLNYLYFLKLIFKRPFFLKKNYGKETMIKRLNRCIAMSDYVA